MISLHSDILLILLQLKIAELFGKIPVIEKNNINSIKYKYIVPDTKNHHNNLIGKVGYSRIGYTTFDFYYIPLDLIEKYEQKTIGIPICSHISICPFCFGIQLDSDDQNKYYKMMKKKDINKNWDGNIDMAIYNLLKDKFCFELVKNIGNS
jgi:hypothetical protein